ncbi:MAG: DNA-binding protein WhiA [Lachnospiraceae bacterium]|nr:DNA-binding protein WhiA [Lachnospiraceae bacterium]
MSFSSEVRQELSSQIPSARHCRLAELAALIGMSGEILSKEGCPGIKIRTENLLVARKSFTLLQKTFNIRVDVSVHVHRNEKKSDRIYTVLVKDTETAQKILRALKMTGSADSLADAHADTADDLLVQQPCCRRAYIRGAFLGAGSISNPEKSYHFEIVCSTLDRAKQLQLLIHSFGPDAKIVQRKSHYIVYIKEGAQIVDMLNVMGAHVSLMNLENIRIVREMRNSVNRKVNCEAANINKTVNAAVRQTEDIRTLRDLVGFEQLPPALADIAQLRLEHPDASLKELGEMLKPPIGKSGVNHRLRKLSFLAEQVRQEKGRRNYYDKKGNHDSASERAGSAAGSDAGAGGQSV